MDCHRLFDKGARFDCVQCRSIDRRIRKRDIQPIVIAKESVGIGDFLLRMDAEEISILASFDPDAGNIVLFRCAGRVKAG